MEAYGGGRIPTQTQRPPFLSSLVMIYRIKLKGSIEAVSCRLILPTNHPVIDEPYGGLTVTSTATTEFRDRITIEPTTAIVYQPYKY